MALAGELAEVGKTLKESCPKGKQVVLGKLKPRVGKGSLEYHQLAGV